MVGLNDPIPEKRLVLKHHPVTSLRQQPRRAQGHFPSPNRQENADGRRVHQLQLGDTRRVGINVPS
jgi:hypothetical protein